MPANIELLNMKNTSKNTLSILLATLTLPLSLPIVANAQSFDPSITSGGFAGGTFTFPVDNVGNLGNFTGIEELNGINIEDIANIDSFGDVLGLEGIGDLLPEPIADLFRDIANFVGQVETFLAELGIEVDLGELGLPDLEAAFELFEEDNQIDIASDVFGTQTGSTVIVDDSLRKQYLKDLANEFAQNTTLSVEGQENTVEQIELSQETAEVSNQYAQDSNSQDVSQNILRNISNQLALRQQLDNMAYFGLQEEKIARSLMLAIQGESVVALDRLTTIRDREAISIFKAGTYHQGLLSIPAQHLVTSN